MRGGARHLTDFATSSCVVGLVESPLCSDRVDDLVTDHTDDNWRRFRFRGTCPLPMVPLLLSEVVVGGLLATYLEALPESSL